MGRGNQLSLFGTVSGEGYLFSQGILDQYLDDHETTPIPDLDNRAKLVRAWVDSLAVTKATETTLEGKFVNDILVGVLGYKVYPSTSGITSSVYPKPSPKITKISRVPDIMLGEFDESELRFMAVVELKSPGTKLDMPQPSHANETPVEQAFYYGTRILGVRWVLITDMRVIRLYSVESGYEYEQFDLQECVEKNGAPNKKFRRLHFLLHYSYLIANNEKSQVSLLYAKSAARQLEIRDSFYQAYYNIRLDLFDAIKTVSSGLTPKPTRADLLQGTQRLLDRLMFIYYCEDHPQQLIPNDTVAHLISAVRRLPGSSNSKVYEYLKMFFREVDKGSPPTSGVKVAGYNGELFKEHWIIDNIELPDSLHDKLYLVNEPSGTFRRIQGVWGLHVYDFWAELNEHLLGHIFEESLSDLEDLGTNDVKPVSEKLKERKKDGIFYTSNILSDFLSASALHAILDDVAPLTGPTQDNLLEQLQFRLEHLLKLRTVDLACGSGAFLVSVYREMLQEFWRLCSSMNALMEGADQGMVDLFTYAESIDQASLLRDCIHGVDKLPQAVEIAKLALWLRSARKGEKVPDLSDSIIASDSLNAPELFSKLKSGISTFDIVIGNPPWGGEIDPKAYQQIINYLGVPDEDRWDSWELFLLLSLKALRVGGRLALVLPDSFLYPRKARLRKLLFAAATVEKIHYLGPDWFGKNVRMGTVIVQAKRGPLDLSAHILCALLSGVLRERAIRGEIPLNQIEAQRSRFIPISRPATTPSYELEVFRGEKDDLIMQHMETNSHHLGMICERARGEEMSKTGLLWICPSCLNPSTPGTKKKGGGYDNKKCTYCGHILTATSVEIANLVEVVRPMNAASVPFVDGDDVNRRYYRITPNKWLRLGLSGWEYKNPNLYKSPKILVRQAGIGLVATLDYMDARCPQSIYIYRLQHDYLAQGYEHEFVLAALLSRTMTYFVFKRYSEVDPAKAHPKLTHERLANLPIPKINFSDPVQQKAHSTVVANVKKLLSGAVKLGDKEDREIEQILRNLWGIDSEGAYINGEFYDLPDSQVLRDLFPNGRPKPVGVVVE